VKVLYLGGFGRSGTTLLAGILGEIPDVVNVGELVHLWTRGVSNDELCGCGQSFHRCEFWTEVGATAFGGWSELDPESVCALQHGVDRNRWIPALLTPPLWPAHRRRALRFAETLAALYAAIRDVSGAKVIVDSSKHASYAYVLRGLPSVDLRVVHMIRSPHGVAHSWGRQVRKPEVVGQDEFMPQYSPWESASLWMAHNSLIASLNTFGVATTRIRYEDLINRPQQTLAAVLGHAGITESSGLASSLEHEAVRIGPSHSVAGNPMRFYSGHLRLQLDERWKREMSAPARTIVSSLTYPMAARYGYTAAPRR
jgi:hypothetical protein